MRLPRANHPIYKLLNTALILIGMLVLVYHGVDQGHIPKTVDTEDGIGAIGLLALANLGRMLLNGRLSGDHKNP